MPFPRAVSALLLLVVLNACAAEAPPAPPENVLRPAELTRTGGCGDAFVYVTNADNSVAITINWSEAASRAREAGLFEATATLPDEQVSLNVQFGQELSAGFCTDIIEPDRPRILAEAPASTGEAEISVLPAPGAEPFMPLAAARVTLRDVVFEVPVDDTVEIWRIELFELPEVQVGWLAG